MMETLAEPVLKPDEDEKDKTKGVRIPSKDLPVWQPEQPKEKFWPKPKLQKGTIITQATIDQLRLEKTGENNQGDTYASPLKNIWVTLVPNPEDLKSYRVVEDSHGGGY